MKAGQMRAGLGWWGWVGTVDVGQSWGEVCWVQVRECGGCWLCEVWTGIAFKHVHRTRASEQ